MKQTLVNFQLGVDSCPPRLPSASIVSPAAPAEIWSARPAAVVGLGAKGIIAAGKDADFVVWDPDAEITVGEDWKVEHKHKLTPYHGMKMKGKIVATYLRGEKIYSSLDERGKYSHNHRAAGPYGRPLLRK